MHLPLSRTGPATPPAAHPPDPHKAEREAAVSLEANFISEMLKHAGVGESRKEFGGGVGEDQFASMLRDLQARAIAQAGGFGLSEVFFQAMVENER